jgi:hypothetical protein
MLRCGDKIQTFPSPKAAAKTDDGVHRHGATQQHGGAAAPKTEAR